MSAAKLWITLPFSALLACSAHLAPKELVDARAAYDRAAASNAPKLVPAELHVARESLDVAERKFADDPDSQDAIDSAYIAMRKAQRAEALGDAAAANNSKVIAEREQTRTQQAIIENQQGKLQKTESQLAKERDTLAKERDSLAKQIQMTAEERQKRIDAEKKAHDAMDALSQSLAVKADTRGTVITLSGGVLFATGQATILPGAQAQLNQVADALRTQAEHHFTVEGHTDNQGTDAINNDLSNRRANAVRDYLVVRGVAAAAITAQGVGSTRPVADNKTTEGRAMNRRVEIIVDRAVTATN
ncbi:MAG TPA: OmpA family protein [Kofleriaceae bacterium]|nr:OmpA family protein [Kofleriaceae bacterium]